jgi:hypothetical protein
VSDPTVKNEWVLRDADGLTVLDFVIAMLLSGNRPIWRGLPPIMRTESASWFCSLALNALCFQWTTKFASLPSKNCL